jgi:hypothetical protein
MRRVETLLSHLRCVRLISATALFILTVTIGIVGPITPRVAAQEGTPSERALGYLRSVYDNSTVGLMSEQPFGDDRGRKLYWLNDNIFVYAALKAHGSGADGLLANKIHERIIEFAQMLNLSRYDDGFPKLGIHEVILGYPITLPLPCFSSYILDMGSYRLGFVIANGTRERECVVEDFNGFADMILYQSLATFYAGHLNESLSRFQDVVKMWDGNGIADSPFRNPSDPQYQRYATYKLALLLYVAQKLNETLPFKDQIAQTIWNMQAYNGGIITNYLDPNLPIGVVNSETTALVVLANPPTQINVTATITSTSIAPTGSFTISTYLEIIIALAVIIVILNATVLASMIRRRVR